MERVRDLARDMERVRDLDLERASDQNSRHRLQIRQKKQSMVTNQAEMTARTMVKTPGKVRERMERVRDLERDTERAKADIDPNSHHRPQIRQKKQSMV